MHNGSAAGAGSGLGWGRLLAGVGEGFPVVLSGVAIAAGHAHFASRVATRVSWSPLSGLTSPRSAAENEALTQLATAQNKAAFLSMSDTRKEGTFIYPTGEPLVYSNWAPQEPNNDGGSENCVEIFPNGKWNDKVCGEQRLVICEF